MLHSIRAALPTRRGGTAGSCAWASSHFLVTHHIQPTKDSGSSDARIPTNTASNMTCIAVRCANCVSAASVAELWQVRILLISSDTGSITLTVMTIMHPEPWSTTRLFRLLKLPRPRLRSLVPCSAVILSRQSNQNHSAGIAALRLAHCIECAKASHQTTSGRFRSKR